MCPPLARGSQVAYQPIFVGLRGILHKLQDTDWQNELTRWGKRSDLLLLQEAQDAPELTAWLASGQFKWQQVAAFRFQAESFWGAQCCHR